MIPMILALVIAGGTMGPQIVSHDVMYCASQDIYKFDIRIDGAWDFATVDEQGQQATGLRYLLGEGAGVWTRGIRVVGAAHPFTAEIRMGDLSDGDVVTSTPIRSFDAESGWLQFTLPTWAFGPGPSRQLRYSVLVTAYGEGSPVLGWSYPSVGCTPVETQTVTWGSIKAMYR